VTNPADVTPSARPLTGRTAIVHDWFQGYHGAEHVADVMRTGLFAQGSEPDIYTFMAARERLPPELSGSIVKESRLATLPGIRQRGHDPGRWRYLLPYMPRYFRSLDLDDYDIVISSSHACAAHVRPRSDAFHAVYCYTPMRYAWMPETDQRRVGRLGGMVFDNFRAWLRKVDREAAQRPDLYLAISTAVQERIRRFYGRESVVVGAPVDVEDISPTQPKDESMFLWVHRLVPYKRPELVLEAFRDLPYKLTMVGIGPLEPTIRKRLPPNVELLTWVSRETLVRLYERAGGFIHVGEEDFGITMVEALAAGTPVIALSRGGARDIVRHGMEGLLLEEPSTKQLRAAIREFVGQRWDRSAVAERGRQFSQDHFIRRVLEPLREGISSAGSHARR
jgi:glycosyltransferase involved in cell wall biosynthesis